MRLTLDLETRSTCDLRKAGAWKYSEDPGTDVLCAALKTGHAPPVLWVPDWVRALLPAGHGLPLVSAEEVRRMIAAADEIEAHNAEFERALWENVLTPRYGWPAIPLAKRRCSLAKCSMHALPRGLDQACKALGLPVAKDAEGYTLMLRMCKPRKPSKKDPSPWHQKPEQLVRLCRYCLQDVEAEHCLSQALDDLPPGELQVWRLDQEINARGIQADVASSEMIIDALEDWAETLTGQVSELTAGAVKTPRQLQAFRDFLADEEGLFLEDLTRATVDGALADAAVAGKARALLLLRRQLSKSSVAKYEAITRMAGRDGRIRGTLLYHGASTARWSGRGLQPQNLPRGSFADVECCLEAWRHGPDFVAALWDDPMDAAATCIRSMLVSAAGKDLLVADFSSIEARVTGWLAGEASIVEAFRAGKDLYKVAAQPIYNKHYEDITKAERQIGKVVVLACGYQGFVGAFQSMAKVYGVQVEDDQAREIVLAWRDANPKVVELWRGLEEAAFNAVRNPGSVWSYGVEYIKVAFKVEGRFLLMRLPSGRKLYYYKPEIVEKALPQSDEDKQAGRPPRRKKVVSYLGTDSTTGKFIRQHTYGGKLTENAVQAIARDLMVNAMFHLEAAGYPVVLTVHDEVVCEVPDNAGSVAEMEALMCRLPAWAAGLPMAAEGWRGKRYRK